MTWSSTWNANFFKLPSNMSQQKQRGKARTPSNRGSRSTAGYKTSSQNSNMVEDFDYRSYENQYLTHVAMSLMGCLVQVCVKNGIIYEGIFRAVSPKMEVNLELAHIIGQKGQIKQDVENTPNKSSVCDSLLFPAKDIASITAQNIDLEFAHKKEIFATDQQISRQFNNGQINKRQLQPWKPHGDCNEDESSWLGEDSPHMENGWDVNEMFEKNKNEFGVETSYDSDMPEYTIPLDKNRDDKEYIDREKEAERIAHEIENSPGYRDRLELDSSRTEEERYAAVVKRNGTPGSGNKYITPARRQGGLMGEKPRELDIPQQIKEPTIRAGSPKPQKVLPAKSSDEQSSTKSSNEQVSLRSTSPSSSELALKADKLQINASNTVSQPSAALSAFSTVTTVGITTVTATMAPISSTVAVTASISSMTTTVPTNSLVSISESSSDQTISGERKKGTLEELREFHSNFNLDPEKAKKRKGEKESSDQKQAESQQDIPVTDSVRDTENKTPVTETVQENKQSTNDSSAGSILTTSKLNPNAKEFKFNPNAKEFKPQQRYTPPMQQSGGQQQYAVQSQVPLSPGPSYSPSFSMQQTYQPSVFVLGQSPSGHAFRPQAAKSYNIQARPYGPRDQPGEAGMSGPRFMTAAAAAGSPIITPGTPPQQMSMMPQAQPLYQGVPVPQQVIPQQSPGVNYVPIFPTPSTPPHFMTSHSAGISSSGLAGTPSYTYSLSQDVAPVQMYVTGNMATVPGSPAMQPQPQPSPAQPINQFVVHVPSQVPFSQPVGPPQGGPITGHPGPSQIVYVSGGPQHASQVATVPVSSSPFQQPAPFTGRRSENRAHGPRVHHGIPPFIADPRAKPTGS